MTKGKRTTNRSGEYVRRFDDVLYFSPIKKHLFKNKSDAVKLANKFRITTLARVTKESEGWRMWYR